MRKRIKEYQLGFIKIKDEIVASVMSIPSNPKLKVLSESPRCFSMQLSDLGDNWSPEYHDFRTQARIISQKIMQIENVQNLLSFLNSIAANENVKMKEGFRMRFHPEVCNFIQGILNKKD